MQGSENHNIVIVSNKVPIRCGNIYHMLVLEWTLFVYYLYLFSSIINSEAAYDMRILIYCLIFLLFQKLELTYKYLQFEDPLHLTPTLKCIRYLIFLLLFNLTILLLRIVIQHHNLHAFIIFIHYLVTIILFLSDLSKKSTKLDINVDHSGVIAKISTPLFLFMFNKTANSTLPEFWFIQFLIFAANLFVSTELICILFLKECHYFGWMSYEQNGKQKSSWNKRRALRTIIVVCCILIVTQNLLLIFQKIKYEISITIIHTFLLATLSYLLYTGRLPLK